MGGHGRSLLQAVPSLVLDLINSPKGTLNFVHFRGPPAVVCGISQRASPVSNEAGRPLAKAEWHDQGLSCRGRSAKLCTWPRELFYKLTSLDSGLQMRFAGTKLPGKPFLLMMI